MGKTTVLTETVEALKRSGFRVGGMLSREVREGGIRVGFEITDLATGKRGWLAHVAQKSGPQVGKYRVNVGDLEAVGAAGITQAVADCDVVAVDEIGPMELFSQKFRDAVQAALDSGKLVVAVVHWRARDRLVVDVKSRGDAEVFTVTPENRDALPERVVQKAMEFLQSARD